MLAAIAGRAAEAGLKRLSGGHIMSCMTLSRAAPLFSKADEWTSLKGQFDASVHEEDKREDGIQMHVDGDVCRRFGELISRAARYTARSDGV
jgi:hypothetical protein